MPRAHPHTLTPEISRLPRIALVIAGALVASACGGAPSGEHPVVDTTDTRSKPLLELVQEVPQIRQFHRALERSTHRELLETSGPFTVLAPEDEAFLRFVRGDSALVADFADTLETIVGLHLVRGDISPIWNDSLVVSTVAGQPILLRKTDTGLTIQGFPVLAHYIARNGILYVISTGIHPTPPDTSQGLLEDRMAPV